MRAEADDLHGRWFQAKLVPDYEASPMGQRDSRGSGAPSFDDRDGHYGARIARYPHGRRLLGPELGVRATVAVVDPTDRERLFGLRKSGVDLELLVLRERDGLPPR